MEKTCHDRLVNDHRLHGKNCSVQRRKGTRTRAPRFVNAGNSVAEYGIELKMRRHFSPVSAMRRKYSDD